MKEEIERINRKLKELQEITVLNQDGYELVRMTTKGASFLQDIQQFRDAVGCKNTGSAERVE